MRLTGLGCLNCGGPTGRPHQPPLAIVDQSGPCLVSWFKSPNEGSPCSRERRGRGGARPTELLVWYIRSMSVFLFFTFSTREKERKKKGNREKAREKERKRRTKPTCQRGHIPYGHKSYGEKKGGRRRPMDVGPYFHLVNTGLLMSNISIFFFGCFPEGEFTASYIILATRVEPVTTYVCFWARWVVGNKEEKGRKKKKMKRPKGY